MNDETPRDAGRESLLLQAFVGMADTMVDDYDVVDLLAQLADHVVGLFDAAAAGILLADQRGRLQVLASSTEQIKLMELFQLQNNEGPCLDCISSGEPVLVADLASATNRWPRFATMAVGEGFPSVHAIPLRLRRETIGALNLFGSKPGLLSGEDLKVLRALADTATIGILQERAIRRGEVLTEQLQTALNSRIVIEQAKGAVAQAANLEMDQAFEFLRTYARRHNIGLSKLAQRIVTGELRLGSLVDPRTLDGR